MVFALAVAYTPLVTLFFRNLWTYRPHYGFFPVVLFGVAWLVNRRRGEMTYVESRFGTWSLRGCLIAGLVLLAGAVVLFSPWVAAVGAVFAVGAFLLAWLGSGNWLRILPVWMLLWLVVPPPFRLDEQLIQELRSVASVVSSQTLDYFRINHFMEGNVLRLPDRELFVEEACSGINSLFSLFTIAAFYCVIRGRRLVHAVLLLGTSVAWALAVNSARISIIALADVRQGIDLASGWKHEALGYALMLVGVILILSTDKLLEFLLAPVDVPVDLEISRGRRAGRQQPPLKVETNPVSYLWNHCFASSLPDSYAASPSAAAQGEQLASGIQKPTALRKALSWGALAVAVPVCAVQILMIASESRATPLDASAQLFEKSALPEEFGAWKLTDFQVEERDATSDEGRFSQVWTYKIPGGVAKVSFDYPFNGWHELTRCYRGTGWRVTNRKATKLAGEEGAERPAVQANLQKPSGETAFLVFEEMDGRGRPIRPRATHWRGMADRIQDSPFFALLGRAPAAASPDAMTFQCQLFAAAQSEWTDEQKKEHRARFQELSQRLRAELVRLGEVQQ